VPRHGTRRAPPGADQSRLTNATTRQLRLSALRPPLFGSGANGSRPTRAQQRAAGTNNTALFDIVNTTTANGSLRAPRRRTPEPPPHPEEGAQRLSRRMGGHARTSCFETLTAFAPQHEVA